MGADETKCGAFGPRAEARRCAELFSRNRGRIDGVIVTLPSFGDERAAALNVSVLIQATPDNASRMTIADCRDSFCGKMRVCDNLQQVGVPFSFTAGHVVKPGSELFRKDLDSFAAVCRVAGPLRLPCALST